MAADALEHVSDLVELLFVPLADGVAFRVGVLLVQRHEFGTEAESHDGDLHLLSRSHTEPPWGSAEWGEYPMRSNADQAVHAPLTSGPLVPILICMSQEQPPEPRHDDPHSPRPAWIAGSVLILLGIIFIIRNVAGLSLGNWWALFILIPALGSLMTAFRMYERNGRRFTSASRGPLIGGLVLLAVSAVFLFNLDWGKVWPLILILGGLGLLLTSFERRP